MVKNDKKRNKMLQNVINGHKCLAIGSTRLEIIAKHYRNGNNDFRSLLRFKKPPVTWKKMIKSVTRCYKMRHMAINASQLVVIGRESLENITAMGIVFLKVYKGFRKLP